MKNLSFLFLVAILAACSRSTPLDKVHTLKYVLRSELTNSTDAEKPIHTLAKNLSNPVGDEKWLSYVDDVDYFVIAYPADYPEKQPIFMSEMSMERTTSASSCSPSLTGVSVSKDFPLANGENAIWGRIDFWDHGMDYEPGTEPLCRPANNPGGAGFAFCSEQEGKTVLICISQVTANEALAQQIFETFRWTK